MIREHVAIIGAEPLAPELPQLVSRQHSIAAPLVGGLSDAQRWIGHDRIALDGEAE